MVAVDTQDQGDVVRLLLVGASTAGKAAFARHFSGSVNNGDGIHSCAKVLERNGELLKVQLSDSAEGTEIDRNAPPFSADVGLAFVYDVADRSSFDFVEARLVQLEQDGITGLRVLVGNRPEHGSVCEVSPQEEEELASRFNMAFFETSAKTGENVERAVMHLADLVVSRRSSHSTESASQGQRGVRFWKSFCGDRGGSGCGARLPSLPGRQQIAAGGYGFLVKCRVNKMARY